MRAVGRRGVLAAAGEGAKGIFGEATGAGGDELEVGSDGEGKKREEEEEEGGGGGEGRGEMHILKSSGPSRIVVCGSRN